MILQLCYSEHGTIMLWVVLQLHSTTTKECKGQTCSEGPDSSIGLDYSVHGTTILLACENNNYILFGLNGNMINRSPKTQQAKNVCHSTAQSFPNNGFDFETPFQQLKQQTLLQSLYHTISIYIYIPIIYAYLIIYIYNTYICIIPISPISPLLLLVL